jgi:flagellar biosynthetic protein FliR
MNTLVQADAMLLFLPAFFRIGGLVVTAPVLRRPQVPPVVKAGIALFATIAIWPALARGPLPPIGGLMDLVLLVATELVLGLLMGVVASTLFSAIEMAGQQVGIGMGLSIANVFDPSSDDQVSVVAQLYGLYGAALFLAMNAHHVLFRAVLDSFDAIPVGRVELGPQALLGVVALGSEALRLGVRIAAPIVAILLVIEVGLGLLVRLIPQVNVFVLGFPLKTGIGLALLAAALTPLIPLMGTLFVRMDLEIDRLLRLVALG